MTPRQRDRRNRLIDAALAMLAEEDYERIQVKDVAETAGVSLGTLYNYFSSKERLFAEALVRWADSMPTNIRQRPLRHAGPAEQLKEAVHRALRAFERRPQMARLVHVLEMSADGFAGELLHRMDLATTDAYMQALSAVDPIVARRRSTWSTPSSACSCGNGHGAGSPCGRSTIASTPRFPSSSRCSDTGRRRGHPASGRPWWEAAWWGGPGGVAEPSRWPGRPSGLDTNRFKI